MGRIIYVLRANPPDDNDPSRKAPGQGLKVGHARYIGHPYDMEASRLHPPDQHAWAHTHVVPEDAPVDLKNVVGDHIDRWHSVEQEETGG